MYATSRIIAAVARAHLLPPFLARVHHKFGTPYISTVLSGVAAAIMALFTGVGVGVVMGWCYDGRRCCAMCDGAMMWMMRCSFSWLLCGAVCSVICRAHVS